jgi:hypothetical protein
MRLERIECGGCRNGGITNGPPTLNLQIKLSLDSVGSANTIVSQEQLRRSGLEDWLGDRPCFISQIESNVFNCYIYDVYTKALKHLTWSHAATILKANGNTRKIVQPYLL